LQLGGRVFIAFAPVTGSELNRMNRGPFMRNSLSTRLGRWRTTTIASAIAFSVVLPMATGPAGDIAGIRAAASAALAPAQAPPAPSGQAPAPAIRSSTRTAANRTWFQLATLVATSGNPDAAPGSKLEALAANGVTLRELIGFAYMNDRGSVTRSQIIGAPDWADSQRFDIIVPVPAGGGPGLTYNADQIAIGGAVIPVLQRLLADRFQLRVHREEKTLPALDLVAVKGAAAPDLKPSTASCVQSDPAQRCSFVAGPGFMTVRGMTMGHLAMQLSWNFPVITVPVRDRTGLTDKYDYSLSYVPAFLTAPNPTAPNIPNPAAGTGPSIPQALEARLGLRLMDTSDKFPVVIVDSVQMLTP
jgi:uncharacterized protein (TIGR03435 family)